MPRSHKLINLENVFTANLLAIKTDSVENNRNVGRRNPVYMLNGELISRKRACTLNWSQFRMNSEN